MGAKDVPPLPSSNCSTCKDLVGPQGLEIARLSFFSYKAVRTSEAARVKNTRLNAICNQARNKNKNKMCEAYADEGDCNFN